MHKLSLAQLGDLQGKVYKENEMGQAVVVHTASKNKQTKSDMDYVIKRDLRCWK